MPTSTSDRARTRGLTLLELLIAVALVLALAAIALPALTLTLAQREFDAAAETVRSHLLLARAHAQTSRRAVVVRYRAAPPRVEAGWFDPDEEEGRPGTSTRRGPGAASPDPWRILEPWAYRPLPESVRVSRAPPPADEEDDAMPGLSFIDAEAEPSAVDEESDPPVVRLAVFLPDGSALLGEPFWLTGETGRRGRIDVNPWTGMVVFDGSPDGVPDEPAEEEPEEAPEEGDEQEAADARPGAADPDEDLP